MNYINMIYCYLKSVRRFIKKKRDYFYGKYAPKYLANRKFFKKNGRDIDWSNPTTYNEIINCEKLQSDTSRWVILADKYRVREYIKERGLEDILVTLYGVWSNVDDINFSMLPNKFVLKLNNGWATNIIVKNKNTLDIHGAKKN